MTTFYATGCEPTQDMAYDYFDTIHTHIEKAVDMDEQVQEKVLYFTEEETILSKAEYLKEIYDLKQFVEIIDSHLDKDKVSLKEKDIFNNEILYKDAGMKFLQTLHDCLQNEIKGIINLLEKDYEKYTSEDDIRLNELIMNYNEKVDTALKEYYWQLKIYSKKYDLEIEIPE